MGPLADVRVLDLSRLLPGPACTWYLQGMGAQVDRVEALGRGDFSRQLPPHINGVGSLFAAMSRGKRSLAVDLRHDEGTAIVRRLVKNYHVLVEGFKPGVMENMGLDPVILLKEQPKLVVARLSGFGQTGPWRDRPGHDVNYIGLSGQLQGLAEESSGRVMPVVQVADLGGALVAAMGISAALFECERNGVGRILDVSLTEAALSFMAPHIPGICVSGRPQIPGGEILSGGHSTYGNYRCADDKIITLGALEPKFMQVLFGVTTKTDKKSLGEIFLTKTRDEWVELLPDACVAPSLTIDELAEHPQHAARNAVFRQDNTAWVTPPFGPGTTTGKVPKLGEDTDTILIDGGFSAAEIASLRQGQIVG